MQIENRDYLTKKLRSGYQNFPVGTHRRSYVLSFMWCAVKNCPTHLEMQSIWCGSDFVAFQADGEGVAQIYVEFCTGPMVGKRILKTGEVRTRALE